MSKIPVSALQANKYLSDRGYIDGKYIVIVPEVPISYELIDRLKAWGLKYIYSNGVIIDNPPSFESSGTASNMPILASIDSARKDKEHMQEINQTYRTILTYVQQTIALFLKENTLPVKTLQDKVRNLTIQIRENKMYFLRLTALQPVKVNYLIDHCVKTAFVAIATGIGMKLPSHKLIDIGTIAILHNIGMFKIPSQLYMSNKRLTEKERKAITAQPVLSFNLLKEAHYPMQICLAVLEVHENIDGTGYPRKISGGKISDYAKIIHAASSFAAMVTPRPHRPAINGHTVMRNLLAQKNTEFDTDVLQAMVKIFSFFPHGTHVKLATGHNAVVIDVDPEQPRCPVVRILTDQSGNPMSEQGILKTDTAKYAVSKVLSPEEILSLREY